MTMFNARSTRRAIVGAIGAGAVSGAALLAVATPALADPPPNCTAGDRAQVQAGVSASMSVYLYSHPDINAFFTSLKGQPVDQIQSMVQDYLAGNPQASDEIHAIRQPLADFKARCGIQQGDT